MAAGQPAQQVPDIDKMIKELQETVKKRVEEIDRVLKETQQRAAQIASLSEELRKLAERLRGAPPGGQQR
jgi:peptidoglycan hydrolase CwlO-like protein